MESEKLITAYVTVMIPVGLAYDKVPGKNQRWNDALSNFIDHPALKDIPTLEGFVQQIEFVESKPIQFSGCTVHSPNVYRFFGLHFYADVSLDAERQLHLIGGNFAGDKKELLIAAAETIRKESL